MIDLLAAIVHTDPAPIAAGMLLFLALGMYPVGILLPSCCGCKPCDRCPSGTLPGTITVTFPEIDDEMLGDYRHRIAVSTTTPWAANAAKVSARVSETVDGEITAVQILDGGSGYAMLGRVAPTLTFSGGGGAGATFTPTLTSSGTPTVWTLASATASGGTGYVDGQSVTITAATGDTTITAATATIIARAQPTITATASGGSGASLGVSLSQSGSPPTWAVSGVSVSAGGTGYTNGAAVTFTSAGATTVTSPAATINTIEEPAHTIDASGAGGAGATFSITYEESLFPGYWQIASISVTNGGSGYSAGGTVLLKAATGTRFDGDSGSPHEDLTLEYTLSGDAIDTVWLDQAFLYPFYRDRGIIQSVAVTDGGSVYLSNGAAYGVAVTSGGSYYREDKSAAPYVALMTATVENASGLLDTPSLSPVVDANTASATFGTVTSFTITDGGGGHYYRELNIGKRCCRGTFAEKSFVLKRSETDNCRFIYEKCEDFGSTMIALTIPPQDTSYGPQPCYLETDTGSGYGRGFMSGACYTKWTATTLLTDCSEFSFSMESGDRVLSVSPGGTYHTDALPAICSRCCTGGTLPGEIEVELENIGNPWDFPNYSAFEGTYVLETAWSGGQWYFQSDPPPGQDAITLSVAFQHCGEWATPSGYRKQDPNESTDLVGVRGFGAVDGGPESIRQDVGVISAAGFTKPAAPPPPDPDGWPCPVGSIDTPYANDGYSGTAYTRSQDFVSHCGTDCSTKCFLVAALQKVSHTTNLPYDQMDFDTSKPYGEPLIYTEGEPGSVAVKIEAGYEVSFDYFSIPSCGGAWYWNAGANEWQQDNPPLVDIPQLWPGRDHSQATCDACESNLCDLSGREIVMANLINSVYAPVVKLTIQ